MKKKILKKVQVVALLIVCLISGSLLSSFDDGDTGDTSGSSGSQWFSDTIVLTSSSSTVVYNYTNTTGSGSGSISGSYGPTGASGSAGGSGSGSSTNSGTKGILTINFSETDCNRALTTNSCTPIPYHQTGYSYQPIN